MTPDAIKSLADRGELIAYFGYGSLVNPNTHRTKTVGYANARLHRWQRRWTARPDIHPEPIALLTSSPTGGHGEWLAGLVVFDHIDNLSALDAREAGYDRREIEPAEIEVSEIKVPAGCPVYVYEGRPPARPDEPHFILQSYLDAVLQGYCARHGAEAVVEFVRSTDNFSMPVYRDRLAPRYPRHVVLSDSERLIIDQATEALNFSDTL